MATYKPYTDEHLNFIRDNYTKYLSEETAKRFNRKFKTNKSRKAIQTVADRMGLTKKTVPGFYTVSKLALLCGVNKNVILRRIVSGSIKAEKYGSRYLIDDFQAIGIIKKFNDALEAGE